MNIPSSKASFNEQALTPGRRISECQEEWKRRSQKGVQRVANKQLFSLSGIIHANSCHFPRFLYQKTRLKGSCSCSSPLHTILCRLFNLTAVVIKYSLKVKSTWKCRGVLYNANEETHVLIPLKFVCFWINFVCKSLNRQRTFLHDLCHNLFLSWRMNVARFRSRTNGLVPLLGLIYVNLLKKTKEY